MYQNTSMLTMIYLCLLWIFISFHTAEGAYSATAETSIRTTILTSYDAVSRPVAQTAVKVGLSVLAIDALDLKNQQFSAAGWLTFEWTDSRLTWTPASNSDIEEIFVTPSTVWKPELIVDNSLDNLGVISDTNLHLRVTHDGTVEWEPPELFETHCQVDISYYPYDRQKCGIEVVSWGYAVEEVKLEMLHASINLEDFEKHGEWKIEKSTIEIGNLTETTGSGVTRVHPEVIFWLYLVRRSEFYDMNVMIPVVITSLLVILVFVVPVDSGEKLSYILTVFLALAVLLTLVADALPSTSISTSVLGLYLACVLILAGIACILTVVVLILHHKEGSPRNPSCKMAFVRGLAKLSCSKIEIPRPSSATVNKVVPKEDAESMKDRENDVIYDVTWTTVSIILDKFCFILFAIVTIAMNISFIIALAVGGAVNTPD